MENGTSFARKAMKQGQGKNQSLEFVAETRILAEMKIENCGKRYFHGKKIDKDTDFFSMKIKMMDLWMQIEGTKLIFIMNFSVLDFFKFASRMPNIAQILVSPWHPPLPPQPPPPPTHPSQKFPLFFFFSLAIPGSDKWLPKMEAFEYTHSGLPLPLERCLFSYETGIANSCCLVYLWARIGMLD